MEEGFGAAYARSLAQDYQVPALGATVLAALERGDRPQEIWRAVWAEFELPAKLR